MARYDFLTIEKKWQDYWLDNKTFKTSENKAYPKDKRAYVLDMFPYPSGAGLHVGHPEGYTATDIYCRYLRANGYNVLHPIGFDSFGLPAENYAIKTGIHPKISTEENIENFRRQIRKLGFSYDWDREVATHSSDYYKWTQWIFLQLYKKGLAYEMEAPINWCSSCLTGLANEEVSSSGKCDRCGNAVVRKPIRQWVMKITEYAEQLLTDLDSLEWSEAVKTMQRNWIGKSTGAEIDFKIDNSSEIITVYSTRPDTIFGASYLVLAPEHKLVSILTTADYKDSVLKYQAQAALKSDLDRTDLAKDKSGVFTGAYAINPANGNKIPIWLSDYVLANYGTGAIMSVPAHDERDFEFAIAFNLPIIKVVANTDSSTSSSDKPFCQEGVAINSDFLNGLTSKIAKVKMIDYLTKNNLGRATTNYKLRDWLFSRQRYWGEPIPLVHCSKCGIVPLNESDLPLTLPPTDNFTPSGSGESPLANISDWVNTTCPTCHGMAKRETNTMPQWAGSCWYYLRYLDPTNQTKPWSKEKEEYWMPVSLYIGGMEHAVLHLLYSRFWHKVLYDLGLVSTKEPFSRLINQGMILGEDSQKMSKSRGNVINPDDMIDQYGSDSLRMYEMFMGPLQVTKPWNTSGLAGLSRFLGRVWDTFNKPHSNDEASLELQKLFHKTLKKVTQDTANLEFNTAISQMMIFINDAIKQKFCYITLWKNFVIMLAPYAPHLCEEMWQIMGNEDSISFAKWPLYNEELANENKITIGVQINGKVRDELTVTKGTNSNELLKLALALPKISTFINNQTIKKQIAIVDKIVNIVT